MKNIYIDHARQEVEPARAVNILTDQWIDNGECCNQTTIDLRDALAESLADRDSLAAENQRLRDALETLGHETYNCGFMLCSNDMPHVGGELMNQAMVARQALKGNDDG